MIHVRRAKVNDFPALLGLINLAFFKNDDRRFETALPHLYADAAVATEQAYLAELDGRLVGHVGVYPLRMKCGPVELLAGGIGAVACHPDFRRRGVISAMLPVVIRGMEEARYDVSVLWGARTRYRRYGWDDAGKRLDWRVDFASPTMQAAEPISMRPVTADDLPSVTRLWNADLGGTIQTEASMARILTRRWQTFITSDCSALAMIQIDGDRLAVDKLVAHPSRLPGLLKWLRQQIDMEKAFVLVRCAAGESVLSSLACVAGEQLTQVIQCMLRILRPEQLAKKLDIPLARLADPVQAVQSLFGSPIDRPGPAIHPLHIEIPAYV